MSLLLTGATGFVGSSLLRALIDSGHIVTALVRTDEKAAVVEAAGAQPVVGDLTDLDLLARLVADSEGMIHTASPGDATNAEVDGGVVDVVIRELAGTGETYLHTGGNWIFGNGSDLDEDGPRATSGISAWRAEIEQRLRESAVRSTVIAPGIVYGHGAGIPNEFVVGDEARLIGDGSQRWATVHVDDLADLYLLAYAQGALDEYYLAVSGVNPTVRELGEAAAHGRLVVAESPAESRERLGELYADALLLDQAASGRHAKESLGWRPGRVTLVDDLAQGSYAG